MLRSQSPQFENEQAAPMVRKKGDVSFRSIALFRAWLFRCAGLNGASPIRSMADEFPYDVFLSHSAKDKAVVRDVAERLRKDGVKVWFDEWVLKPGDSIESPQSKTAKIEEGLERSRVLVLCMSANAFGSDWAQLESGTFQMQGHHALRDPLNKERRFLPLRLDEREYASLPALV